MAGTNRSTRGNESRREEANHNHNMDVETSVNDDSVAAAAAAPMEDTMTCVSIVTEGRDIGFACYNEHHNEILLESSHAQGHEIEEVVESFFAVAHPNLVLINNKIAGREELLQILTRPPPDFATPSAAGNNSSMSGVSRDNRTLPYRLLKSSAFDERNCKTIILKNLRILSLLCREKPSTSSLRMTHPNNTSSRRQQLDTYSPSSYHAISSLVDFDTKIQVKALGSLLSFLQDTIFRLEEGATITVNNLRHAESSKFMRMNAATLESLHIFSTEHHPLMAKGQGHVKEGFSLFTLLDRTKSKVGRQCLREWMLKPLLDHEEIAQRQDGVELFMQPEVQPIVHQLLTHLEGIGAVDKILLRMQKLNTSPSDFVVLAKTLESAIQAWTVLDTEFGGLLKSVLADIPTVGGSEDNPYTADEKQRVERFLAFVEGILRRCKLHDLNDLYSRITSVVDQDLTVETKQIVVKDGYHEGLDHLRETYEHLDETLESTAFTIYERLPEQFRDVHVHFLPQMGFLVSIDKQQCRQDAESGQFPDLPQDFAWFFSRENTICFKNDETRQLDAHIGDLDAGITDTVNDIVYGLEEDILDCETALRSTFSAIAELDCILAFASCAFDNGFTRPKVLPQSCCSIQIKKGRHPLQELIVDGEFIPNDTIADGKNRVNIITGPNFSGKSCYTRQVGMLVYMAHIGCYLPCESAAISITDQIFTRISVVESCSVPQSSFQLDLTQMGSILRRSTASSLVLIDELGKGTSPSSGIAVLTSAIKKLSRTRCKVVCTTHFLEVFTLGFLQDGVDGISAHQMTVHIPRTSGSHHGEEQDGAAPLFKLEKGVADSSAGLVCAKRAGVNEKILTRAKEILTAVKEGRTVMPLKESIRLPRQLTSGEKGVLRMFLGVDSWENASDQELASLAQIFAGI